MPLATAKLLDLRLENGWYWFRFTAEGEEFEAALHAIKQFRLKDRIYDPKTKCWALRAGPGAEDMFKNTFINGRTCLMLIESQLPLFPDAR